MIAAWLVGAPVFAVRSTVGQVFNHLIAGEFRECLCDSGSLCGSVSMNVRIGIC